jgi:pimeloyl-ACP methyl ester carboxylesterase
MNPIPNRKRLNWILPAAFLLILAAAVAAVFVWRPRRAKAVTVPPGAKAGDLFFESCPLEIGGAEYAADWGTLVVPENRGDPGARLIALLFRRIRSPSENSAEPIFKLEGGPGASNFGRTPPVWLLAGHDYVQMGYRGVDGTPKLDCPGFAQAAHGTGSDLLGGKSLGVIADAAAACASMLQSAGIDLRGYAIPEVVENLEAARVGLGYGRIDLLSESYGTRIAQIYAHMHPQSLRRSAMIGVNPPGHFLWPPETVDAQIEYCAGLCRKDPGCRARTPDLAASMRRVNQSMPADWMGIPIDPGKVRMAAFFMLFHRTTAPIVFDAYLAADGGDPSGLAALSMMYGFTVPNMMTWGEWLALGASADLKPGRDYRSELEKPDSILGAPFSEFVWKSAPDH